MSFLRALLVASALTMPITLAHMAMTDITADAAAKKKTAKKATKKASKKVAAYKSCGTYMYRKGGKCLDARNKK